MAHERFAGLLYILLGIMLIVFPMVSSDVLSICIGFALVFFGIAAISKGFVFRGESNKAYSYLAIAIGIFSLIFGILFIFSINALTFLTSLEFYIIGIIMMAYGFVGIFYLDGKNKISAILVLILGILVVVFAAFLASQPILIAVLVGVALMIEGAFLMVIGRSVSLIEKNE